MLKPFIQTKDGLLHGVKHGMAFRKNGTPRHGTWSWCGHFLQDLVANNQGEYISKEVQELGYEPNKVITCFECLSEGPPS